MCDALLEGVVRDALLEGVVCNALLEGVCDALLELYQIILSH